MSTKDKKSDDSSEEYLREIRKMRDYAAERFDRLMVYLSSGGLVLSIGFIKDIVDINKVDNLTPLIWSWVLFIASLLLILVSHRTSHVAMDKELKGESNKSDAWDGFYEMKIPTLYPTSSAP